MSDASQEPKSAAEEREAQADAALRQGLRVSAPPASGDKINMQVLRHLTSGVELEGGKVQFKRRLSWLRVPMVLGALVGFAICEFNAGTQMAKRTSLMSGIKSHEIEDALNLEGIAHPPKLPPMPRNLARSMPPPPLPDQTGVSGRGPSSQSSGMGGQR
jgi:hypothetical protein